MHWRSPLRVAQSSDRSDQLFAFPFASEMRYELFQTESKCDAPAK
jgi:hypothetical protein